jgi:hypothetical protein
MRPTAIAGLILSVALTGGVAAGLLPQPAAADEGDISVGGVWVSKITHDAAGFSAQDRAVEVTKRLTEILSNPAYRHAGAMVAVRPVGLSAAILVGDQLAMTIMPEDTAGTGVTTMELARQWAQRLAQGLVKALPDANFHTF